MTPIRAKDQMYAALAAGEFGNTVPMWLRWRDWLADTARLRRGDPLACCLWGVRSLTPGGPFEPHVPSCDVVESCQRRGEGRYQISPMIDTLPGLQVTAMLNVWESPTGLVVEAVFDPPPGASWRRLMPHAKTFAGVEALCVLRRHLNGNSLDDLRAVLDRYPGHVVELSATNTCVGTVPHRNAVVWECRDGTHGY